MSPNSFAKICFVALVLLIAFVAGERLRLITVIHFDLLLTALLIAGLFLGAGELTAVALFALFLLQWPPSVETALFFVLPFCGLFAREKIFTLAKPLGVVACVSVGILIFYGISSPGVIMRGMPTTLVMLSADILVAVGFGIVVFYLSELLRFRAK